ncbi:hypothetical protein PV08_00319 [Exophiala spinifera]|uniref:Bacteriophage T5 Orf172 DNA-binding domain-containing protein n=1 Tax=Exophiala spinifera TaxID=91928 RepID=A0A0D2BMC4_9EURO|nr:uncharacterized protein PV08_00319 [Exophiala spinifera]KIW19745.1 hypothetical protein PV08_00319 [Exophiala spinifera]
MSFSGRTPESLLPRSDSKNPATTCRGITSTGRPCRRALAASPKTSPAPSPMRGVGVLAVLDEQNAAAFYCWQHKDQAEELAATQQPKTTLYPLKEKSSIDTLVERVGILDLDESVPERKRHRRRHEPHNDRPTRRETLPARWSDMQSPIMKVPENMVYRSHHTRPPPPPPPPRSNVKLSWACCIQAADDDDDDGYPPPRTRRPQERNRPSRPPHPSSGGNGYVYTRPSMRPEQPAPAPARPSMTQRQDMPRPLHNLQSSATSPRPTLTSSLPSKTHSETGALLSLIPSTLSPQTTSLLLTELSRPISPADETGYIYIFWLTPTSETSKPDDEAASSLLDDDDHNAGPSARSTQALQRYASVRRRGPQGRVRRTMMLKIGRAENVHRRMTQWTKQCGQNITLVRYYPYTPGRASPQAPSAVADPRSSGLGLRQGQGEREADNRKVPHVHRVERLIHLELAEKRVVKAECEACGRMHQEWFEIEATRAGLKGVDEVIRRWVGWAERQGR